MIKTDTIIALATPPGIGAISVIRLSGKDSITISNKLFKSINNVSLINQNTHTISLGYIIDSNITIDKVLISVFKAPRSYTGENIVEISCHGSVFIQQKIIDLFTSNGCRLADPGEFTLRAFLNGKMDLSQAESVADLISSNSESSHKIAMDHMRGGFSNDIKLLREELLNFASLIELELDFSEEDVEFANMKAFEDLLVKIISTLKNLIDSFSLGNVIKEGIPISIVGEPNTGKSTLLNSILNEDKAIVSDIAGTTRDSIEDEIVINGINFRFIDTAGIRTTEDEIESIGIRKTFENINKSNIVMYVIDSSKVNSSNLDIYKSNIDKIISDYSEKHILLLANKIDLSKISFIEENFSDYNLISISAKENLNIDKVKNKISSFIELGIVNNSSSVVTNSRHFSVLNNALSEVQNVYSGMQDGISSDLLAVDVRQALYHFGELTGEITNDELLGNIFSKFCIGK
ncbi:tRNA uridine-5-carboxymethylaminomethyl(34) synthesis GTPase MnmE [Flavobacteriaceae bacterium]|nr:tRNA uridine-5-carboxymethylaminomethyl(34) synthesis GTPase MnmE [Flavobacteriaceae bacterium]MDC1491742.1 tRNA uridine-5-carboxymethylaminomethyl(34) synthesis GTPase MnmE [Flavobacteriaceae bacterium]